MGCTPTSRVREREQLNLDANNVYVQSGGPSADAAAASIVTFLPIPFAVGYSTFPFPEPLAPGPGYYHSSAEGYMLHPNHFEQLHPPPSPFPTLVLNHQSAYVNAQDILHPPHVQIQQAVPLQQFQQGQGVVEGVRHYQSFGSNSNSSSSPSLFGNSKTRPRAKRWVKHPPQGYEKSTDLFIGNLPPHNITKNEHLEQLCNIFGRVDKAKIAMDESGKPRKFGFVKFVTPAGALNAFYELQKRDVSFAKFHFRFEMVRATNTNTN